MLGVGVAAGRSDGTLQRPGVQLSVFVRERQHLVARSLDRAGLVAGDVARLGAEDALPGAQRRGDHDTVHLRAADEEVDVRLRLGNGAGAADQRAGAGTVGVLPVAGVLLQVRRGEGLQDLRMAALGIVRVKADDHSIYSFESAT